MCRLYGGKGKYIQSSSTWRQHGASVSWRSWQAIEAKYRTAHIIDGFEVDI